MDAGGGPNLLDAVLVLLLVVVALRGWRQERSRSSPRWAGSRSGRWS
jgi:hypothetical protein